MRSAGTLLSRPVCCIIATTLACGAPDTERRPVTLVMGAVYEPPSYEQRLTSLPAEASETQQLQLLLGSYCGYCHASALAQLTNHDGAGMYYVDDIATLIDRGQIIPGAPERSPLLQRITDGTMPPPLSEIEPPPPQFIERLSAFIASL